MNINVYKSKHSILLKENIEPLFSPNYLIYFIYIRFDVMVERIIKQREKERRKNDMWLDYYHLEIV